MKYTHLANKLHFLCVQSMANYPMFSFLCDLQSDPGCLTKEDLNKIHVKLLAKILYRKTNGDKYPLSRPTNLTIYDKFN